MLHPVAKLSIWAYKDRGWASHAANPTSSPLPDWNRNHSSSTAASSDSKRTAEGDSGQAWTQKRQLITSG